MWGDNEVKHKSIQTMAEVMPLDNLIPEDDIQTLKKLLQDQYVEIEKLQCCADDLYAELLCCEDENEILRIRLAEALDLNEFNADENGQPCKPRMSNVDSPAILAIKLTEQLLLGYPLDMEEVCMVRDALLNADVNMWLPSNTALMVNNFMSDDVEVNASLMSLLTGRQPTQPTSGRQDVPGLVAKDSPVPRLKPTAFKDTLMLTVRPASGLPNELSDSESAPLPLLNLSKEEAGARTLSNKISNDTGKYHYATPRISKRSLMGESSMVWASNSKRSLPAACSTVDSAGNNSANSRHFVFNEGSIRGSSGSNVMVGEGSVRGGSSIRGGMKYLMGEGSSQFLKNLRDNSTLSPEMVASTTLNDANNLINPMVDAWTQPRASLLPRRRTDVLSFSKTSVQERRLSEFGCLGTNERFGMSPLSMDVSDQPDMSLFQEESRPGMETSGKPTSISSFKASILSSLRKFKKLMPKRQKGGERVGASEGSGSQVLVQQASQGLSKQGSKDISMNNINASTVPSLLSPPRPCMQDTRMRATREHDFRRSRSHQCETTSDGLEASSAHPDQVTAQAFRQFSAIHNGLSRKSGIVLRDLSPSSPGSSLSVASGTYSRACSTLIARTSSNSLRGHRKKVLVDTKDSNVMKLDHSISCLMPFSLPSESSSSVVVGTCQRCAKQNQLLVQMDSVPVGSPTQKAAEKMQAQLAPTAELANAAHLAQIFRSPSEKVLLVLSKIESWQFDTFELDRVTHSRPLSTLAITIIHRMDLAKILGLDQNKLARFLVAIEDGYPSSNCYHNRIHAADVLRTLHVLLTQGGLCKQLGCSEEDAELLGSATGSKDGLVSEGHSLSVESAAQLFTLYMTAAIHDFDHKGVNNVFLTLSSDERTILYNDVSPNENHHLAASFKLMRKPEYDFMKPRAAPELLTSMRKQMISVVLATDMQQHFSILSAFKARYPGAPSHAALDDTLGLIDTTMLSESALACSLLHGPQGLLTSIGSADNPMISSTFDMQGQSNGDNLKDCDSLNHSEGRARGITFQMPSSSHCRAQRRSLHPLPMGLGESPDISLRGSRPRPDSGERKGRSRPNSGEHVHCPLRSPEVGGTPIPGAPQLWGGKARRSLGTRFSSKMMFSELEHMLGSHKATGLRQSQSIKNMVLPSCPGGSNVALNVSTKPGGEGNVRCSKSSEAPRPSKDAEEEMRLVLLKMLMKAADLGHLASPLHVHKQWVAGLEEEMFRQGDQERSLGLPVSPLMDRKKDGVLKSQVGFFTVVAMPLYTALADAFPCATPIMDNVKANLDHWKGVQEAQGH